MAKEPADRPWDAAAVGMTLTELRDLLDRGEPIPMVWSGVPRKARSSGTGTAKKKRKAKADTLAWVDHLERPAVQTGLLALGLVALLLVVGYLLWPPGAEYLYRHAEAMMASKEPSEWVQAEKDYLDELDRRFPDHPYKDQVRAWRDRTLLNRAERRAKVLQTPNLSSLSAPKTDPERMFVDVYQRTVRDLEEGHDADAARRWGDMADALAGDDPESRPWSLLARQRADEQKRAVADRQKEAAQLFERGHDAYVRGRFDDSRRDFGTFLDRYEKYPDLAEPVARAKQFLDEPAKQAPPSEAPAPTEAAPAKDPSTDDAAPAP
jgi:hypothetical protein